jgi:hypothetical protein
MPSIMACRSKIFCNSAFNAFGNVVRRLWVGARILDWQSGNACRADAFGNENGFLFLFQLGMRGSMLASIQEPFPLS